jgi:hypothetical protein
MKALLPGSKYRLRTLVVDRSDAQTSQKNRYNRQINLKFENQSNRYSRGTYVSGF